MNEMLHHHLFLLYLHVSLLGGCKKCRSPFQWPCGLRRGCAAVRLLGLWFRIPPGVWLSLVSVVCCQVEVSASG